jgi:hypothetical protein
LNITTGRGAGDRPECAIRAGEAAQGDTRVVEVCLIEGIEEVSLKLHPDAFGYVEQLAR